MTVTMVFHAPPQEELAGLVELFQQNEPELDELAVAEELTRRRALLSYVEYRFRLSGRKGEQSTRVHVLNAASERPLKYGTLLAYKAMSMMFFDAPVGLSDKKVLEYVFDEAPLYLGDWGLTGLVDQRDYRFAEQFLRAGLRAARRSLAAA